MFWGVWGAFSSLPMEDIGYPDEMVYIICSLPMLIPAFHHRVAIVGSTLMVYGDEKRGEVSENRPPSRTRLPTLPAGAR